MSKGKKDHLVPSYFFLHFFFPSLENNIHPDEYIIFELLRAITEKKIIKGL